MTAVDVTESCESARSTSRRRIAIGLSLIAMAAGGLVLPFPMDGRLWGAIFDLAHGLVFCAVTVVLVGLLDPQAVGLPQRFRFVVRITFARALIIAGLMALLGLIGEYLQQFFDRSPGWGDVAANVMGILAALTWIWGRSRPVVLRRTWAIVTTLILVTVSVPPSLHIWDCVQQIQQFPLIGSFERSRELDGWTPHRATIERCGDWSTHGRYSMKVTSKPRKYPGVAMLWFMEDWTDFSTLRLDFHNPHATALRLVVKLTDRRHAASGYASEDRFHQQVEIPPAADQSVVIDLQQVKTAPAGREMDLNSMDTIDVFAVDVAEETTWYIDHVRLERE